MTFLGLSEETQGISGLTLCAGQAVFSHGGGEGLCMCQQLLVLEQGSQWSQHMAVLFFTPHHTPHYGCLKTCCGASPNATTLMGH